MKLSSATQTTALVIMFELSPLKVHWENWNGEIFRSIEEVLKKTNPLQCPVSPFPKPAAVGRQSIASRWPNPQVSIKGYDHEGLSSIF